MSPPSKFIPGDLVFAKVKGYPPWPARVTSCESNRYKVFFYGTFEVAKVKKEDIWPYTRENVDKLAPKNLKRKGYSEGLIQIKTTPEIAPVDDDTLDSNIPNGTLVSSQVISTQDNSSESWVTDECIQYESTLSAAAVNVKSTPNIPPATSRVGKLKPNDTFNADPPLKKHSTQVSPKDCKSTDESVNIFEFDDEDMELPGDEKGEVKPSSAGDQLWKLPPPNSFPATGAETDFSFTKIKSPKIAVITPRKLEKENSAEEVKKMWLMVKSTNELIEINVEKEKPASFDTKEDEIQWEGETVRRIQSGELIPPEILQRLKEKGPLSPEEKEMLRKIKMLDEEKEKLKWLRTEQKLVDLDILIKTALSMDRPEPQICIGALEELSNMVVDPFMLKKQPEIVATIRRLGRYVGPQDYLEWSDKVLRDQMIQHIKAITLKADQIYKKFKSMFTYQEKRNFWKEFDIMVQELKEKTDGMEENKILSMTKDPTTEPVDKSSTEFDV